MKLLTLTLLMICFSFQAFAKFPLIDIQRLEGNYLEGKGQAHADKAFYVLPKAKINHENIDIEFAKKGKSILIKDPSTTVELDVDLSFLDVLNAFSFKNLNVKSTAKLFTIQSDNLDIFVQPKQYHFENVLLETDVRNIPIGNDADITILDGIILNGRLLADKMSFKDFDDIVFEHMLLENPERHSGVLALRNIAKGINIPMIIRKLKFTAKDEKLYGQALVDSYINLWFRLWGTIKSDKEQKKIIIHMRKAKLGVFSVTETVLKAIKRLNLEKVEVDVDKRLIFISVEGFTPAEDVGKI